MAETSPSPISNLKSGLSDTNQGCITRMVQGETILFFIFWLLLLYIGRSAMFSDPGTFWHVAAGEKMLSSKSVLRVDPFSFTFAGKPWVADQWLAECAMAVVHRLAGWDGLFTLACALLAGVYSWIAGRMLRAGLHPLTAGVLLAVVFLTGSPQFLVRPLVVTIALLAVTFAWLVDVESGRRSVRSLAWLVPLFVLWTNLHGGVLGGMGTVGLCAAGWCAVALRDSGAATGSSGGAGDAVGPANLGLLRCGFGLTALVVLLAATSLASPYGVALPREWFETLTMPLPKLISEHGPLVWTNPIGMATAALAAAYLAVLCGVLPHRPRVVWLLPLVWLALSVARVRNAPLFGVSAAIGFADMLPHSRIGRWLIKRFWSESDDHMERTAPVMRPNGITRMRTLFVPAVLPASAVAAALTLQIAGVGAPLVGRGWAKSDAGRWPVELTPVLATLGPPNSDEVRVFNDMNLGGFLIYYAPRCRIFIDDRCSLYGADFLAAYDRARRTDPARINDWQRDYGFRYALVETGQGFDCYLASSSRWLRLAGTPAATLYQRRLGDSPGVR
jgi:hypothetical protein